MTTRDEILTAGERLRRAGLPPRVVPGHPIIIPGAFSDTACADIVAVYNRRRDWEDPAAREYGAADMLDLYPDLIARDPFLTDYVLGPIHEHLLAANREHWGFGDLVLPTVQLLRYRPGHAQDWHCDGAIDPARQWIGIVVQLSDPATYTGGALELDDHPPLRAQAGTLVLIPGHHGHAVSQVTAGTRWALTAFAATQQP